MSKTKTAPMKTVFVRNTVQEKPKTVVINEYENTKSLAPANSPRGDAKISSSNKLETKLASPELNSALRITRKMQSVENLRPRKVKSVSDIDKKKKLAADDRVSRQVNFPYEQHLYKDLIPLCVKKPPSQPTIIREPLPLKDKEPVLEDFFKPKVFQEYSYQISVTNANRSVSLQHDGLKLHRVMQNWR